MFKLLGIKLIGLGINLNSFLLGIRCEEAAECIDCDKDVFDKIALMFYLGPFRLVIVF